jgi:hypothetical protein
VSSDCNKSIQSFSDSVFSQAGCFPYSLLKNSSAPFPDGVDAANREIFLSDVEFGQVLKMPKPDFAKLPKWKQQKLKKEAELF